MEIVLASMVIQFYIKEVKQNIFQVKFVEKQMLFCLGLQHIGGPIKDNKEQFSSKWRMFFIIFMSSAT